MPGPYSDIETTLSASRLAADHNLAVVSQ